MILIVDDRPENIFSLKSVLELNNFETDSASSGEEALKKILKNSYALIILDVQMPGMDGFEVAEAITGYTKTRDIPIIFLSAVNTHKRFITKGFESGAVDYITKPVDPDILILKVRNFYRLYEKTHALKEAERMLKATVNELHSTLESLPQIAFTSDEKGVIDFVNRNWFDYASSAHEFPETPPGDAGLREQWLSCIARKEPVEKELRLRSLTDGHFYYHLLKATPVIMNGKLLKWVGTFTNIQEQKSLNEILERRVAERTRELLEINRELELSNHDLQQFASVASHDLKEPLRKIQYYSNLIRERAQLSESMDNYFTKVVRSAERMSKLINDLLSFTRLSTADIFEPTNVNRIISEICSDIELFIREKNAVIEVDPIPEIEAIPGLLQQLFQNIIMNALKFSRHGVAPRIHISAERVAGATAPIPSPEGNFCRIRVQDNGIGFDEKYIDKIFTLFQRLNPRDQYEGTGIGLAIAKKIVDKHNGLISAHSRPGEGATFEILLPMQQGAAQKRREGSELINS